MLMETERSGQEHRVALLFKQLASETTSKFISAAFLHCAVQAHLRGWDFDSARHLLQDLDNAEAGFFNKVSASLVMQVGPADRPHLLPERPLFTTEPHGATIISQHVKEEKALDAVLERAALGDPASVLAAIEDIGGDEDWLKISGGDKACVLEHVLSERKPSLVLEFGTYVAYGSIRLGRAVRAWGGKVVTLEMDPVNAALARNIIEIAGLSDTVTVQLGHSNESLPIVLERLGKRAVDMVFMDQKGSVFHSDLQLLEGMEALAQDCVVVADNVLKPGAPLYLWKVCKSPKYSTQVVRLREFGQEEVEDWMTITRCLDHKHLDLHHAGEPPESLRDLNADSDRLRWRTTHATDAASMSKVREDFAVSNEAFKQVMRSVGIAPTCTVQRVAASGQAELVPLVGATEPA
eukprot:TRINITY_DN20602_c0_g1_i1.p1 TRINITY_DN20602_c0_g1~~TRINITY_DN20602_c0_g1_i1.p1  ORF type:complete len:408 (+),score=84.25 TRINITY_DN20602_c0_g1_i1:363-1586(+)